MVICDKYNFNFIRIPKNASSSLAHFFVKNCCNQRDIYTEVNDAGIANNNVPHNIVLKYKNQYRFIHLTLQEIIDNGLINKSDAIKSTNIGVIRNPFDRQLSLYFFLNRKTGNNSPDQFREHFKNGYHYKDGSNHILQTNYLTVDGDDRGEWWSYDNLDQHINGFIKRNNISVNTDLQQFKSEMKPKNATLFDQYYDQNTISAVRKYYEKDFEKYFEITGIEL